MHTGIYQFAGFLVEIRSTYPYIQDFCARYRAQGQPDLIITTTQADVDAERQRCLRSDAHDGTDCSGFSDDYLETLAVYRKICNQLFARNTLLFHGSALAVDGEAYLFTATSGTGKSTHARLWRELLGDRVTMVNDDKPLLRVSPDQVLICGTPWDGKHRISTNVMVPLKAICILERGESNTISPISVREMLPMLVQQSFHPDNKADNAQYLSLLDSLARQVKFYRLRCNMDPEAARVSYLGLHGPDPLVCVP